jgi:hypothetical protein
MKKAIFFLTLLIVHCTLYVEHCNSQWVQMSNGITGANVMSLAANGTYIYAGTYDHGIYISTNNGVNWTPTGLITSFSVNSIIANSTYLLAGVGTSQGGIWWSSNNGSSWLCVLSNVSITSLAVKSNYAFAGNDRQLNPLGIYISTNNGSSWTQSAFNNVGIGALFTKDETIYAGGVGSSGGVYLTTNNGTNWISTTLGNKSIRCFVINGSNIFAGSAFSGDGVYKSTDNGLNWTHTALYSQTVSLAVWGNNIFAGTVSDGVFMSSDNGSSWIQKNQGFTNLGIFYALIVSNNYIFAGTYGESLWRRSLSEITGTENISNEIPSAFSLYQNYPNPFNPSTNIRYQIPKNSTVSIKIFDLIGKEITTLVNEKQSPGTYEVTFDARYGGSATLPSGIYFYTLTAGDFKETKRMILVK